MNTYHDNNGNVFEYDSLKPCPFCGSEATMLFQGNNHTKVRKAKAKCSNVNCRCEIINAAMKFNTEWVLRVTVDSWNKRHLI